jgi:hypothetical protein
MPPDRTPDTGLPSEKAVEHPPVNEHGFGFPTWEQYLKDAFEAVPRAYESRKRAIRAAHEAGLSYHTIARAVGTSAAMVHKAGGGKQRTLAQEELLRAQAGTKLHGDAPDA